MSSRLVLIRHAEPFAHTDQWVASHNCTGLTARGIAQADALRGRLERTGELSDATGLHTSLMRRAAQTAEIIAPGVGDGGFTATADCSFCERHHGEADGLTWDEYDLRYGAFDALAERQRADAPGEECYEEVVRRVEKGLDRIVSPSRPGSVVVVAHGGVVGAALELLVGTPLGTVTRYVDFTFITEFEWDDQTGRWWLSRLNDAGHLELLGDSN